MKWSIYEESAMSQPSDQTQESLSIDGIAVSNLYRGLLESWNKRSASDFAALFFEDGSVVGFDGSQMNGRAEIESTLSQIFSDHETNPYIGKIKEVRLLTPDTAVLRAIGGMIPAGQSDINPALNTIQSLTAAKKEGQWNIALYQNTPAQFHGRPDLAQQMSDELRELL
jgi:uncharacterized protein (TIGR02246 family)